jgi:hypothetical protein
MPKASLSPDWHRLTSCILSIDINILTIDEKIDKRLHQLGRKIFPDSDKTNRAQFLVE